MSLRTNFPSWGVVTLVLQFAVAAPAGAQDAGAGQGIARENCVRCHAITKTDVSTLKEAPPFRDVVTRYPPASLAESLAEGISTGHPDMPEFVFPVDQIGDLIAYLETLQ